MKKSDFAEQVMAAEATLYHISKSILRNDCDCADAEIRGWRFTPPASYFIIFSMVFKS